MTERDIHHLAVQAKMAWISEEFSGDCFDFKRLSASCPGGLVLKRKQKEAVSRLLEGKDVLAVQSGHLATRESNFATNEQGVYKTKT